jgi:hypothetical protein
MDPVKFYEYRAMGLPVLATPVGEMARRRGQAGVHLLPGNGAWKTAVDSALRHDGAVEAVRTFRTEHTWNRRFDAVRLGAVARARLAGRCRV